MTVKLNSGSPAVLAECEFPQISVGAIILFLTPPPFWVRVHFVITLRTRPGAHLPQQRLPSSLSLPHVLCPHCMALSQDRVLAAQGLAYAC